MLQNIRDKSQGWIAWIIISLLIFTFALWGIHAYVTEGKSTETVAKVAGINISKKAVQTVYERLRQQQQLQLGADFVLDKNNREQLRKQALNQIILSTLLVHAAQQDGYRITIQQIDEGLLQIPAFQINGQFSADRFHEILNSLLYTQQQFLSNMRQSMLINQVEGGYINSAFALPNQINMAIALINQKRDINYTIIPAARFVNQKPISPVLIQEYYQAHLSQFKSPEQVSIAYLLLSLSAIKTGLHFDQTKLQQYYENNLQNYTQPAQWQVAYILLKNKSMQEINAIALQAKTQNFNRLAKIYSADKATADNGGKLPWFTADSLDPVFEKAAVNLQQIGEVSAPVATRYGYVIIKLLGKKPAQVLPFNVVKNKVNAALAQQQAEQLFANQSDKLANLTYANPDSLKIAAQTLNLSIQTTAMFDQQGTKTGITANPQVIAAAFSQEVLTQHNNSDVLTLNPQTAVVLRVTQVKPARILPLTEVKNIIQLHLAHEIAKQQAEKLGKTLLVALRNKQTTPVVLGKRYQLPWQIDKNANRYDGRVDNAILRQAFHMPFFKNKPSIIGITLPSGDYALIMLTAIHDGQLPEMHSTQWRIFNEQLAHNNGFVEYQLYVKGLMKNGSVKFLKTVSENND